MEPFARYTIARHSVSCFLGTNFIEVTRGESTRRVLIPGESVEAQAAAAGPDILWLALTGDTSHPCVWYDPAGDLWHELDLTDLRKAYGCLTALPCILAGPNGVPVWWFVTGYEISRSTLVISLSSATAKPRTRLIPGSFVSASMVHGHPRLQTATGEHALNDGFFQ